MKKLVLLLLLAAVSAGASEIRFQLYKNGFCTGNPAVSEVFISFNLLFQNTTKK